MEISSPKRKDPCSITITTTIFLCAAICVVMFIPRIGAALRSDKSDGDADKSVMLVKADDPAYAEEVESLLKEQIAYRAKTYREYMPAEYPKISSARIERNGCYVLVIVAEDVAAAYRVYTDALK